MALHFRLRVNEVTIGIFAAQRQERDIPEDRICTYNVSIDGVDLVVRHNYDDGAWTLIRKAIETMEELDS